MTVNDILTARFEGEVADPAADPPAALEDIHVYNEFLNKPELFQRIHVHLMGARANDGTKAGIKKINMFGMNAIFGTVDPLVVVDTVGDDTGSVDHFPIGNHIFGKLDNTPVPVWDAKAFVLAKKGKENTSGIKLTMYDGSQTADNIILKTSVSSDNLPTVEEGWKEFVMKEGNRKQFKNMEFVFSIRVTEMTDRLSTKDDIINFCKSTDMVDYSEEVIEMETEMDNALLQCWRHKKTKGGSNKAVMWFIGRNDCFMHPHVANDLFVGKGYDLYFFNYSCDGMTRKRGWVGSHFNSHNRTSSFDLYIGQIEKALEIVKAGNYEKTLGYAHSTGGPVLINYLMKKGDADFDGFIFNSPFLDWGFVGGDAVEFILEDGIQLLSRLKLMKADFEFGCASTPESFKEPIMYMDGEIVLSAWAAKLFSQWFFDFRCRPLYTVPLTAGFCKGVTGVHDKLLALRDENKYVTKKPFVCISSRADDTLKCSETMKRIDIIGPSRVEIELRHNAHDVFLSEEMNDVKMALNLTRTWMEHNGFE